MKAHKYWSVGALITMLGTFYTGYKIITITDYDISFKDICPKYRESK